MTIKIDMLKCFVAVAKDGSLSSAADALGRTPSAVSMMLKQFEDHIGVSLFETARKSKLSTIGALIYEEARQEVSHFEKTVSVIEGLSRSEFGFLRLVVTPSVAINVLPSIIQEYVQRFPGIQLDLRDMDSAAISHEMINGRADIGIGSLQPVGDLIHTDLFSDRFGVICHKNHPLAQNWDQLTWRDLNDHVFIANGLCHLIKDPDFLPILESSELMVPSTASLLGLVRAGVGISVLPRLAALGAKDDIAFLPLHDATIRRPVQMLSQPQGRMTPALREFLTLVSKMKQSGALVCEL
ncbi:LysR family transcriptional regulator [Yoonia sp. GPGPB17]|uniref:LysR family transcriptional regulator n=1 Tax=Yoonia sp. GPGPB17 TaxID=3026147 RepID=UPI0030C09F24